VLSSAAALLDGIFEHPAEMSISMNDSRELWCRIHESFKYHREATDPDAQAAMDRIATKCIRLSTRKSFNANNCAVREGLLEATSLHELRLYHSRAHPYHLNGPIIVLLYEGAKVVIEGNTRVNAWIAGQYPGPFEVIIVEPRENAV
jgi:hypothetical protein